MRTYFYHVAIGIDQLANTILGGMPDETISAKCYRMSEQTGQLRWRFAKHFVNVLMLSKTHCYEAAVSEENRTQISGWYRK